MVISDAATNQGIFEDIDFNCDTDSTSFPANDKARKVNNWLYNIAVWILQSSPNWEFDDSNYSNLPKASTDLVNNQEDYSLPAEALRIEGVSILDSGGNEKQLKILTLKEYRKRVSSATRSTGQPDAVLIRGASVYLDPIPVTGQVTLASGLKFYLSRNVSEVVGTDTTKVPGVPIPWHPILSWGPSADWWLKYDEKKYAAFMQKITDKKHDLTNFHESRIEEVPPRLNIAYLQGVGTRKYK